jgi:hypothetical protein
MKLIDTMLYNTTCYVVEHEGKEWTVIKTTATDWLIPEYEIECQDGTTEIDSDLFEEFIDFVDP